jgi:hypothetical protein
MLWLNFAQENYSAWFFGCLVVGVLLFRFCRVPQPSPFKGAGLDVLCFLLLLL